MRRLLEYFKGAYAELRKVIWPTPKETWRYSVIIIIVSLAVAVFVGGVDFILSAGLKLLP